MFLIFIDMEKVCTTCMIIKPIDNFGRRSKSKDGYNNKCKECKQLYDRDRWLQVRDTIVKKDRRSYFVEYQKNKQSDPIHRAKNNLRNRIRKYLKQTGIKKDSKTFDMVGLSPLELSEYISKSFRDGMTWENYGEWHIDHIVPLCSAKTQEELIKLFHYSNLQPLWVKENLSKGGKVDFKLLGRI